jgi:gas vesicle protein
MKMGNQSQQHGYLANSAGGFLAGLLMGGLIGSGAMLLLAPQSGKKTREKILHEGIGLRDQVSETVEEVVLPMQKKARRVASDVRRQAKDLEQQGQDIADEQEEIVSQVVDAEKKAVRHATKG